MALGGEFGGGGSVSTDCLAVVERGVRNLLRHAGILDGQVERPQSPIKLWQVSGKSYYTLALEAGLFEPEARLGDVVRAGETSGHIHFVDNPNRPAEKVVFQTDGMVICRRHLGRVERGDCVMHLATEWKG